MRTRGINLTSTVEKPDTNKPIGAVEWAQLEQYYTELLQQIVVPAEPDPSDLTRINAELDKVYSEARLDYAKAKKLYEKVERKYKLAMKEVYIHVKDAGTTDKHREALGVSYLKNTPLPGDNMPVTAMLDIASDRIIFMEAVIDVLKDKAAKLITDNGAMKLDVQLMSQG